MAKKYNYNYVFLFYDVEEKRCNKVFKVCKKYLNHYQKSVFRGEISPSKMMKLKKDLDMVIDKGVDYVSMIKLLNQSFFEEEHLGKYILQDEEMFI